MPVRITKFLGRDLILPQDRLYDPAEGLWARQAEPGLWAVGLSEPAMLMAGTVRELEALVSEGQEVQTGQSVVLALTAKIKYLASPLAGVINFPPDLAGLAERVMADPYATPLFQVTGPGEPGGRLVDAQAYALALGDSEGARNPEGHVGPGSSTCKALYMGLGQQRLAKNGG